MARASVELAARRAACKGWCALGGRDGLVAEEARGALVSLRAESVGCNGCTNREMDLCFVGELQRDVVHIQAGGGGATAGVRRAALVEAFVPGAARQARDHVVDLVAVAVAVHVATFAVAAGSPSGAPGSAIAVVALVAVLVATGRPRVHDRDALVVGLEGRAVRPVAAQVAHEAVGALVELLAGARHGDQASQLQAAAVVLDEVVLASVGDPRLRQVAAQGVDQDAGTSVVGDLLGDVAALVAQGRGPEVCADAAALGELGTQVGGVAGVPEATLAVAAVGDARAEPADAVANAPGTT